jgi:hypothetical protein
VSHPLPGDFGDLIDRDFGEIALRFRWHGCRYIYRFLRWGSGFGSTARSNQEDCEQNNEHTEIFFIHDVFSSPAKVNRELPTMITVTLIMAKLIN